MKEIRMKHELNWRKKIPVFAETLYHVAAKKTGYLHNVNVEITLTPIRDGEEPSGWGNIEEEIQQAWKLAMHCWELGKNDFAYSLKKII